MKLFIFLATVLLVVVESQLRVKRQFYMPYGGAGAYYGNAWPGYGGYGYSGGMYPGYGGYTYGGWGR